MNEWLVPDSSVSLLLGFSAILSVSLVSRLTARSLHDYVFGYQTPSGERSWNKYVTTWSTDDYGSL